MVKRLAKLLFLCCALLTLLLLSVAIFFIMINAYRTMTLQNEKQVITQMMKDRQVQYEFARENNEAIKQMADHVIKLRDGVVRKNIINETKVSAVDLDW